MMYLSMYTERRKDGTPLTSIAKAELLGKTESIL